MRLMPMLKVVGPPFCGALSSGHSTITLRSRTGLGIQSQKFLMAAGAMPLKPIGRLVEKLSDRDASRLKRRFGD
jgi:hypothetical protein